MAVLSVPDTTTPLGLRDRAMLEVFYSTAIRRAELAALCCQDVDFAKGTLFLSATGRRLGNNILSRTVTGYVHAACHPAERGRG